MASSSGPTAVCHVTAAFDPASQEPQGAPAATLTRLAVRPGAASADKKP